MTERMRKSAKLAEEQWHKADAGPLPLVPVHWAEHYAKDIPEVLDERDELRKRVRQMEKALRQVCEITKDSRLDAFMKYQQMNAAAARGLDVRSREPSSASAATEEGEA